MPRRVATIAVLNDRAIRGRFALSDLRCASWWALRACDLWVCPLHPACLTQNCEAVERTRSEGQGNLMCMTNWRNQVRLE
jgi:hypothetical protein